jgi:hypothetical protein
MAEPEVVCMPTCPDCWHPLERTGEPGIFVCRECESEAMLRAMGDGGEESKL